MLLIFYGWVLIDWFDKRACPSCRKHKPRFTSTATLTPIPKEGEAMPQTFDITTDNNYELSITNCLFINKGGKTVKVDKFDSVETTGGSGTALMISPDGQSIGITTDDSAGDGEQGSWKVMVDAKPGEGVSEFAWLLTFNLTDDLAVDGTATLTAIAK